MYYFISEVKEVKKNAKYEKIISLIDYYPYNNEVERLKTIAIIRKIILRSLTYSLPLDYALDGTFRQFKILPEFLANKLQPVKDKKPTFESAKEFGILSVFSNVSGFSNYYNNGINNLENDIYLLVLKNLEIGVSKGPMNTDAINMFLPFFMANYDTKINTYFIDDEDILKEYDTDGIYWYKNGKCIDKKEYDYRIYLIFKLTKMLYQNNALHILSDE